MTLVTNSQKLTPVEPVTEWADAYAWAPISSDKDGTPTNQNSSTMVGLLHPT